MSNLQKYISAFSETFQVSEDETKELQYRSIPKWDSVGHMQLVLALEDAFDIMFDADDIIDLSSFEIGKEILKKYDVDID